MVSPTTSFLPWLRGALSQPNSCRGRYRHRPVFFLSAPEQLYFSSEHRTGAMDHEGPTLGPVVEVQTGEQSATQHVRHLLGVRGGLSHHLFGADEPTGRLLWAPQRKMKTYLTQSFQDVLSMLTGNSRCSVGLTGDQPFFISR